MVDEQPGAEVAPTIKPMTSTEKVWGLIEYLQESEDEELAEAFPIKGLPVGVARGALAMLGDQLPKTPDELDAFLTQVADFCSGLRSDGYGT